MRLHRRIIVIGIAVGIFGALSGCGVSDRLSHEETRHFDARADAPTKGMIAFAMPEWVPADARDITMDVQTQGKGKNLSLRSDTAELASRCESQTSATTQKPIPEPQGWPTTVQTEAGAQCGEWRVVVAGERLYAWTLPSTP